MPSARSRHSNARSHIFHVVNRSVRDGADLYDDPNGLSGVSACAGRGPRTVSGATDGLLRHVQPLASGRGSQGHGILARFMQWVTVTHAVQLAPSPRNGRAGPGIPRRFSRATGLTRRRLIVARLPLRRAERALEPVWSSARKTGRGAASRSDSCRSDCRLPLASAPFLTSTIWIEHVNAPATPTDLAIDQQCDLGLWERSHPTSVPQKARICGKKPRPPKRLSPRHQAPSPGAKRRKDGVDVGWRAGKDQTHTHVERAEHLRVRRSPRALQPAKQRRHCPALAVK